MSESEVPEAVQSQTREEMEDHALAEEHAKARKAVKKAKASKAHKTTPFKAGESGILTKAQREQVIVVTDETDPLYNPKVRDPEDLSESLVQLGWLQTNPLSILPDGRIMSGRTKWLSLKRAEKKLGKEIPVPYIVVEMDEEVGADATDALDIRVQKLNPMVVAEKVARFLSRGRSEKEFYELTGIKPEDQHGYLLLMERLPEDLQDLVRQGLLPFAAATEVARSADKLTEGEMRAMAEQVAKMANGGVRVTSEHVKQAAGKSSEGPATKKEVKQFLLDLQSDKLAGKHGEAVTMAIIIGLEVGLGTRTLSSAKAAGRKLAHGESIKVDFLQYNADAGAGKSEPVKGQGKKK